MPNAPTTYFRDVDITSAATTFDSLSKRGAYLGTVVNNGGSNPWDFGTVDISMLSAGVTFSVVKNLMWRVSPNGDNGNDVCDNFKFWVSREGFESTSTRINFQSLSDLAGSTETNTDGYVANAITTSYTFTAGPGDGTTAEPSTQNVYAADDTASVSLTGVQSGATSEAVWIAAYYDVADNETTGTYEGTATAGYELVCSFKFDYS